MVDKDVGCPVDGAKHGRRDCLKPGAIGAGLAAALCLNAELPWAGPIYAELSLKTTAIKEIDIIVGAVAGSVGEVALLAVAVESMLVLDVEDLHVLSGNSVE